MGPKENRKWSLWAARVSEPSCIFKGFQYLGFPPSASCLWIPIPTPPVGPLRRSPWAQGSQEGRWGTQPLAASRLWAARFSLHPQAEGSCVELAGKDGIYIQDEFAKPWAARDMQWQPGISCLLTLIAGVRLQLVSVLASILPVGRRAPNELWNQPANDWAEHNGA